LGLKASFGPSVKTGAWHKTSAMHRGIPWVVFRFAPD
jgi:hypothetical protein